MKTVTQVTRANASEIINAIIAGANAAAAKFGMVVERDGGARFSPNTVNFKLIAATKGQADSHAENLWASAHHLYGLPPNGIGKTFKSGGEVHTIKALNTRRPKFPVSTVTANGRAFKFSAESVVRLLKAK